MLITIIPNMVTLSKNWNLSHFWTMTQNNYTAPYPHGWWKLSSYGKYLYIPIKVIWKIEFKTIFLRQKCLHITSHITSNWIDADTTIAISQFFPNIQWDQSTTNMRTLNLLVVLIESIPSVLQASKLKTTHQ